MKILLIHPITRSKNLKSSRTGVTYPLGVGYVGAYLERQGHQVTILDNNQKCYDKSELKEYLEKIDVDIVGISSMANTYNQVRQLCRLVKELKQCPIIIGGALPTYSAKTILENFDVDVCVLGEGEETSAELLEHWPEIRDIAGIAYQDKNGNYVQTALRIPQKSRDEYPYPGYDGLLDITNYWRGALQTWENHIKDERIMKVYNQFNKKRELKIGTMLTGLGCPYQCTFCTNSTPFMKTRERSPENVAKEALYLKETYGVDAIRFEDDLLILQKERTLAIAKAMKETGLFWSGHAVGRSVSEENVVKVLAESNCVGFGIGIESGSDRLLKAMRKGSRSHHFKSAFKHVQQYGLGIRVQLIYGMPGEDTTTLSETIDFFKETGLPPRRFNKLFPMPGSGIYDQCIEQGIIIDEHDYLNHSSMVANYTSKSNTFNLTRMTTDQYLTNLHWAEESMKKNYQARLYRDPLYWLSKLQFYLRPYNVKYYIMRILQVTPVLERLANSRDSLKNFFLKQNLLEKHVSYQTVIAEKQLNSTTRYYPDMEPDETKPGFVVQPLIDERVENIMRGDEGSRLRVNQNTNSFRQKTVAQGQ